MYVRTDVCIYVYVYVRIFFSPAARRRKVDSRTEKVSCSSSRRNPNNGPFTAVVEACLLHNPPQVVVRRGGAIMGNGGVALLLVKRVSSVYAQSPLVQIVVIKVTLKDQEA